jgi:hypothetical protein
LSAPSFQLPKRSVPSTKHQAPSTEHRAPSTKHQASSSKQQASSIKHQAPSTEHQAPSIKHQAPSQRSKQNYQSRFAASHSIALLYFPNQNIALFFWYFPSHNKTSEPEGSSTVAKTQLKIPD